MSEAGSPRKAKRVAEHQINKDEDPEGDGGEETAAGTFQRASAEVLKTRRIVKARARPLSSASPSSPQQAAAANPFASLASTPAPAISGAAAKPNPFRNVVISPKPTGSAVAPPATGEAVPSPAKTTNGGNSSALPRSAAAVAEAGESGSSTAAAPAAAPTSCSAAPAVLAAEAQPTSAVTAAIPRERQPTADAVEAQDEAEGENRGAAVPAAVPVAERKDSENGTKDEGGDTGEGDGGDAPEVAPAVPVPVPVPPAAGAVSFAALGVSGKTPFKYFKSTGGAVVATTAAGAADRAKAPMTFGGFGSSTASHALGAVGTLFSGAGKSGEGAGAGPVLSFGSTAGPFSSFTSFSAAPAGASGWGSSPEGRADGKSADGGEKGAEGAASGGGSLTGVPVTTKPPLELMDPSEVVNGEEMEECTYKARGKLFRLADKEWVEKGIGNLKVLRSANDDDAAGGGHKDGGDGDDEGGGDGGGDAKGKGGKGPTARLVMRREAGQQVMINVSLQAQTRCSLQGEKALLLACFTPDGPTTYLIKVKTSETAGSLKAAIDALIPPAEPDSAV